MSSHDRITTPQARRLAAMHADNGHGLAPRQTRIGCQDLAGHNHELIVVDHPAGLALVFPPNAWAAFAPAQVEQLRARLSRSGPC